MRLLLDTEAALRSIIRTAGSAIVCLDIAQRIGEFNPAAERMFGVPREDAIGRPYASLFPQALQAKIEGDLRRIAGGASVTDFENVIRGRDDGMTVVLWNIQPLLDVDGIPGGVVMVGQDITARQRAEEALLRQARYLEALSARLVDVQEAERRRLAGELHDEIGQALTALLLQLEAGRPATSGAGDDDGQAADVVRELIAQVRDLSHDLRPAILDDLGLLPALLWHVERFSRNTRVPVDLRHDGIERRFAARIETAVYRIVQEALTNVARHAGAAGARVRVSGSDTAIQVGIEDDGAGFDPDRLPGVSSGLSGMRERATLLGGRFTVRSSPGSGTRIEVELPIDPQQARPPGDL